MKIIQACALAAATAGLWASAPAAAQTPPATAPAATNPKAAADPNNQMVCERQELTGSRLGSRRVCMTRAQWADLRLQDRQEIEKAQTRRGMKGE